MIKLVKSLAAWETPEFGAAFKGELEQLAVAQLPLQQGLSSSSFATDGPRQVVILSALEKEGRIQVKAGIFYWGISAGCSCADDPTPSDEVTEYCEVWCEINKRTAEATVALLGE